MAFRTIIAMEKWEVFRRWHSGQTLKAIAHTLGYDRKTVRRVITHLQHQGLCRTTPLPDRDTVLQLCEDTLTTIGRSATAQAVLVPHLEELKGLISNTENPLQAKIAFEVLCTRYDLASKISYSSFKRFMQTHANEFTQQVTTCRIETPPGKVVQIDYARAGRRIDQVTGKSVIVNLFIATLGHSRHKYVEVVTSQDQKSFVASHARMFAYFGGVTERVAIDNLKSGVIKPDLYDPTINHSYREMAEHYHCFIDPCRVRHPKDKGKVERDVKTIRAQYRKFAVLYPQASLAELTDLINTWVREKYGTRKHGTTNQEPYSVFTNDEQPTLGPLPEIPFVVAEWKQAKVHPDHYVQFNKQAFSVPHAYVLKNVWVRATEKIVEIYFDNKLVQQHLRTDRFRHTDLSNFPANIQAALDEGMPMYLQQEAGRIGPLFRACIRTVLQINAFINMRRAQGLVSTAKTFDPALVETASRYVIDHRIQPTPQTFKQLLLKIEQQATQPSLPLSAETESFIRPPQYFSQS
jgi:hypothetical protein